MRVARLVPSGHKVALRAVAEGAAVHKYGQVIGFATAPIAPGDHVHSHNLGVGAITSDLLVMTIGTSLAVRMGSATTAADPQTRPFCYVLGAGRYIVGGPSNNGGNVLDWLFRKVLGGPKVKVEGEPLPPEFVALLNEARDVRHEDLLCLPRQHISQEPGDLHIIQPFP